MTRSDFLTFYPQFSAFPAEVISTFAADASLRFSDLEENSEEARRLYTAHKLVMYARTSAAPGAAMETVASAGSSRVETGKHIGDISVTYAAGKEGSGSSSDLGLTDYGLQLLTLLRFGNFSRYIP